MTFVIYTAQPSFPATDQNPNCIRYQVGNLWVDTDNAQPPTQADIDAIYAPGIAEAARIATIKANTRQAFLMNALTTLGDTAINSGVAARYPGLTGDTLKFAQDVALVLAVLAKR